VSWETPVVVVLVLVDVTALAIGISIRRTVTRIVSDTAHDIEVAVKAGIADAVGRFVAIATVVLGDRPGASEMLEHVPELLDELTS
jgi:hypothetical protein